jgi:hypothetical protein
MKIEISEGDFYDKLSILQVKLSYITDPKKVENIQKEYNELLKSANFNMINDQLYKDLFEANVRIWYIEDSIRKKEKEGQFDAEFINLARLVYYENDKRAELKRQINLTTCSDFIEEKQHVDYRRENG